MTTSSLRSSQPTYSTLLGSPNKRIDTAHCFAFAAAFFSLASAYAFSFSLALFFAWSVSTRIDSLGARSACAGKSSVPRRA